MGKKQWLGEEKARGIISSSLEKYIEILMKNVNGLSWNDGGNEEIEKHGRRKLLMDRL
jgi:hypothetical protein